MNEAVIAEPQNLIEHPVVIKKGQTIKILVDDQLLFMTIVPTAFHRYLFQLVAVPPSLDEAKVIMLLEKIREEGYILSIKMIATIKQVDKTK